MSAQPVRDAIDRWQQARPLTAVPCAVAKKFTDDGASRLAALIAYWGFFSIFPLLLAFASILGFLLEGNPEFQKDVLDSTVAQIPGDRRSAQPRRDVLEGQRRRPRDRDRRRGVGRVGRDPGDRQGARHALGASGAWTDPTTCTRGCAAWPSSW